MYLSLNFLPLPSAKLFAIEMPALTKLSPMVYLNSLGNFLYVSKNFMNKF